ncbi:hypothetical protein SUGI_1191740 [Cryptomeria japonica]|uniref:uncharacterized protein LOC131063111 n=1 Tax=Cryptomeria japonica TaxID=3369 RepID=UPI00241491A0|nr:uncharacterized protein LOC131063111 [Cryptomeria japonica]GLJ55501.1 hypothetical protein SUGI_1191740 [Cryptomeria japonica]
MEDENDAIARVMLESEYKACRAGASTASIYKGGEGIELNTSGSWYFMSRISDCCKSGEKVMIRVDEGGMVRNRSLRHGGSGHGGEDGGSKNPKGGNRSRFKNSNSAAAVTCSFLIVLLGLSSILFNIY